MWGAGGGGGGGSGRNINNSCMYYIGNNVWIGSRGGWGGSGGYNADSISVTPGTTYSIIVGLGGLGGAGVYCGVGESGGNGGITSFNGILDAPGGMGGDGQHSNTGDSNPYNVTGSAGAINNWMYPTTQPNISYIPPNLLTPIPGIASGGQFGERGQTGPVPLNPATGGDGMNGFCIVSY